MADAGDPGRYTVRVAESAPGGSGAAASQTRARLQDEADQAEKIKQQKAHKNVQKAYRARKAAAGAAGGAGAAASQTRANTFADLEVGPGARRYTVRAAGGSGAAYLQAIGSTEEEQVKYYKQLVNDFCT